MTPQRWHQIEDLCRQALDRDPAERKAFLRDVCAADEELRADVESLLAREISPKNFLRQPAIHEAAKRLNNTGGSLAGRRLGGYQVVSIVGTGGMGEVYRARDTRLGRDVAIKVLRDQFSQDPEFVHRYEREGKLLASLNHPNIAAIYHLEEAEGHRCLVLEFVEGKTLAERLKRGRLSLEEAPKIARQISEALESAHEKGIVHRDLKPANIKIKPDGTVKVLDFGIAKLVAPSQFDDDVRTDATTHEGVVLGTAAYMSPEQARGQLVNKRTDIWAFGCVLYEMLAGRPAFSRDTVTDTIAAVLEREPAWDALPPGTPAPIYRLLRRSLEKNPERRLHDIADARLELDDALSAPASSAGPAPAAASRARSARFAWLVGVFGVLASLVMGIFYVTQPSPEGRVMRLSVLPPEGTTLGEGSAISPDGRLLVFPATDTSGQTLLWIRALDSTNATVLAGTNGASFPFWSPDNQSVGFFSDGKLKKIAVRGGPPQTLCDAPNGRGGSWNRGGFIVFNADSLGPLYGVSAMGGDVVAVTTRRRSDAAARGSHRWPQFLPDGRHFLYFDGRADPKQSVDVIGVLDSADTTPVLATRARAAYAPPGYLLFMRERALMAQRFDAKTLHTSGEPVLVADEVWEGQTTGYGQFSVSENAVLAYQTIVPIQSQLVWLDRHGKELAAIAPVHDLDQNSAHELSPDEKQVAFVRNGIWLLDLSRGISSRFISAGLNPVWSPDSNSVLFTSLGSGGGDLYSRSTMGSGKEELVLTSGSRKVPTDWSKDGRFIVYSDQDPNTKSDVWILPVSGAPTPFPFLRQDFNEGLARLSPDGAWMTYVSDESGQDEVYVERFPSGGNKVRISTQGGSRPQWRRDGRELFYVAGDGKLMGVAVKTGATFDAAIPTELFPARIAGWTKRNDYLYTRNNYAVTSDGQRVLVNVARGSRPASITVVVNWPAALKK